MFKNKIMLFMLIMMISFSFFNLYSNSFILVASIVCLMYFLMNQHLTILLVQLEVLVLSILVIMALNPLNMEKDFLALFSIMVIAVVEASIGLSLTVKQARYYNKELLKFYF